MHIVGLYCCWCCRKNLCACICWLARTAGAVLCTGWTKNCYVAPTANELMAWHELVYAYAANFCETCAAVLRCAAVCCSYMYLGVALTRLEDHDNAAAAYRKAISIDPQEPLFHLNYGEQAAGCNLSER